MSDESLEKLKQAFKEKNLALYLGAGVSAGNRLPNWEKLVLIMYFLALDEHSMEHWRPFPNYLIAIAEWYLQKGNEPLEITARKTRNSFDNQDKFLRCLHDTLYLRWVNGGYIFTKNSLLSENTTLKAVTQLCRSGNIPSVVTYNYDNLLETALDDHSHQTIWQNTQLQDGHLPIYHVHGYVPFREDGSEASDIVFTEDQYHQVAQDPYCWSNLVQIQTMSNTVGLMIGLSLADRNMRRLLDAVKRAPVKSEHYALLLEPKWEKPADQELDNIHRQAMDYFSWFEDSGIKGGGGDVDVIRDQVEGIAQQVDLINKKQQTKVLKELGITPIWYDDHGKIAEFVGKITAA